MKKPLLTVCLITYNHAKFIKQSINSILEQETDFPWQLVIADDYSTDGTRDILKEYQSKHPERVQLILQKKNVGAESNWTDLLAAAQSKYVVYGEGDDYYIDPAKLQKQVDFLEQHPDYAICFHPVNVVYDDGLHPTELFPSPEQRFNKTVLTSKDLLANNFMQTNSVMYRWEFTNKDVRKTLPKGIIPGDWYLHLYHAKRGKIGFIDDVMSVYRRHSGGLWWDQRSNPHLIWKKYGYNYLLLLHHIMLLYGNDTEGKKIINNHIAGSYEAIAAMEDKAAGDHVATAAIGELSAETWDYIRHLMQQVEHYSKHDAYLQGVSDRNTQLYEESERQNQEQRHEIQELTKELVSIKTSKAWKAAHLARRSKHAARHPINSAKRIVRRTKR